MWRKLSAGSNRYSLHCGSGRGQSEQGAKLQTGYCVQSVGRNASTAGAHSYNHSRGTQLQPQQGHTATTTAGAQSYNHSRGTQPQPQQGHTATTRGGAHSYNQKRGTQLQPEQGHTTTTRVGAHSHNQSRDYWIITAVLMDIPITCLCRRVD
jgi:hypothetical protein